MESINQHKTVLEQYKTADNLNTRISIHTKYSTNKLGFGNWLFSHYDISANNKILELGCGTGDMWSSKLHLIDQSIELTLTDLSENMVSVAKNTLGEQGHISYGIVNIEKIPYTDNYFDRVIANMMLYHVPSLDQGLSEVKRILTGDGYFYCATYGENGIMPFIAGLLKEYGITDTTNKNFTLQNGYGILKKYFSNVQRLDYEDSLAVTDVDDVLDYIYSLTNMSSVAKLGRQTLKEILEKEMVNGVLNIPKEYGMFICKK
ncbi:MAG: class I SAM-dependent methyltransferase [Lachnospiraceae bacterium]|nr:class I SAM-dependent methyltransferase [Lachnospiraceae bacterium]MDE6232672.1 class I SAM-dependent methyltransferase [Lachnospiraceae bacterium]